MRQASKKWVLLVKALEDLKIGVKGLGVAFDSSLKFHEHIDKIVSSKILLLMFSSNQSC